MTDIYYDSEQDTDIIAQDINSRIQRIERKDYLFSQREIIYNRCKFHKGENGVGPRHNQDRYKDVRKGKLSH